MIYTADYATVANKTNITPRYIEPSPDDYTFSFEELRIIISEPRKQINMLKISTGGRFSFFSVYFDSMRTKKGVKLIIV